MGGINNLDKSVQGELASDFKVTGISIQYSEVCKRELWFYLNGIDIDRENKYVAVGSSVDKQSYKDKSETIIIDNMIAPDFLENGKVVEVKPTSGNSAARLQLLYYLWYLERYYDVKKEGVLAYPTERKREYVSLDENNRENVVEAIETVWEVFNMDSPPEYTKKPVCSSCAYKDFCMIGGHDG